MQTLSRGYPRPGCNILKGYPLPFHHFWRSVSTTFLKMSKKQLNIQLSINKQQKKPKTKKKSAKKK
jgi:hypothetical protein